VSGVGRVILARMIRLHSSVKTVEVHRANISHKPKLKLKRGTDLGGYAIQWTEVQNAR
jgi:DNA-binding NarL/FixJ family response regulator